MIAESSRNRPIPIPPEERGGVTGVSGMGRGIEEVAELRTGAREDEEDDSEEDSEKEDEERDSEEEEETQ